MSLTIAQRSSVLIAGTGITITNTGSTQTVSSTVSTNFVTKTANYTILSTDDVIFVDTTSGAFTLTFPNPTTVSTTTTTKIYRIIDIGGVLNTNNLTLVQFSTEKIEGLASSKLLQTNWGGWTVTTNHVDWFIF